MIKSLLHYEIKEKLGQGGMGIVYRARDTKLNREVALKFLPSHISLDSDERERFMQEARAAAALNHPNIAQVFAIEEADDEIFIVMEYIDGKELKEAVEDAEFTSQKLESIALQIAEGLKAAHDKGVVHRDIKSGNIMLDSSGKVKIMDFGLARIEGAAQITKTGTTIGTTAYMSPEQLSSHNVDKRSDIWAYGVVLYELFTGELPFTGAYEPAIMYAITEEDPTPASELNEDIPKHIEGIIHRCLKKEPEKRYQNFSEVLDDLKTKKQPSASPPRPLHKKVASGNGLTNVFYAAIPTLLILLLLVFTPLSDYLGINNLFGSDLPEKQGLAILPFKNISQSKTTNLEVVSDGLLETLTSKLAQVDNYKGTLWVIPASEIIQADITSPSRARKEFSVNMAVTGSLQEVGDRMMFTMNLVNAKTLRQLSSREIISDKDSLANLQSKAGKVLLEMLNIELKPEVDRAMAMDFPGGSETSRYYLQGRGYLLRYDKEDNLNNAIEVFRKAVEEDPDYALAHAALGESYWRKYQLTDDTKYVQQAKEALNRAMEINSNLVPVITTLGLINRGTGQYEEAVKNFQKAITLEPNNDMAFRELANIYVEQGSLDLAEENYKIAIQLKPDYWKGYDDLGLFYYQYRGQIDKAIEQFEEIIRLTPENYTGYSQLGAMYYFKGNLEKASELLEKSLEINKTFFAASNLGTIHYSMENYHEAVRFYSTAYKLNPNSYAVLGNLASAHEAVGNDDLAGEYYQKAIDLAEKQLKVNPNNVEIINDLGTYYADIGDNERALKYLNRSLELDSNNVEILYRTAAAYERMGDREKALKWVQEAVGKGYPISDIRNQPELKQLVADERFKKMADKIDRKSEQ